MIADYLSLRAMPYLIGTIRSIESTFRCWFMPRICKTAALTDWTIVE
jgi:hypothetical protein